MTSLTDKLAVLGAGVLGGSIASILFILVVAPLSPWVKVALGRIVLGMGPDLVKTVVRGTEIVIRPLPVAAYIMHVGNEAFETDVPRWPVPPGRVAALKASRWRRAIAFSFAPRLAAFALVATLLGPTRAGAAILIGYRDIWRGAFGPFSAARTLFESAAATLANEGFGTLVAVAVCKWLTLDLVNLPGSILGATRTTWATSVRSIPAILGILITLSAGFVWLIAWLGWVVR